MIFAFCDTYYNAFLNFFYNNNSKIIDESYEKNIQKLLEYSFGTSDFYSYNLTKIGYNAKDYILNDEILQFKWALENKINIKKPNIISKLQMLPYLYKIIGRPDWVQNIILKQISTYKPDVIYVQDLSILSRNTLLQLKNKNNLLIGQIASLLPSKSLMSCYDLILSSFPHYVKKLNKMGFRSHYFKIGFDKRIINRVGKQKKKYDVTFIGSFSPYHNKSIKIFEEVAEKIDIHIWGHGLDLLSKNSPLRKNFHGQAWGLEMYKILAQSKIIINRHINLSENYANNMRMYEATGMGSMLINDNKKNLNDLFQVGREIESYNSSEELIAKLIYYLKNDKLREEISNQGRERTLRDHTYFLRMKELVKIIKKYL